MAVNQRLSRRGGHGSFRSRTSTRRLGAGSGAGAAPGIDGLAERALGAALAQQQWDSGRREQRPKQALR
ncbi:hypothetical protein NDU88_008850 [Pleurodeles waltl]|uniref:Uncharacterized protein n=1 Tax=Pleurodeles waltl TaxID=8319 RepID=A0AAV7RTM7_PLEWA|nr:hypothetical protein NDU88_008850 [Pleurodeles waltl]